MISCLTCGKSLTAKASVAMLRGPTCARKTGLLPSHSRRSVKGAPAKAKGRQRKARTKAQLVLYEPAWLEPCEP